MAATVTARRSAAGATCGSPGIPLSTQAATRPGSTAFSQISGIMAFCRAARLPAISPAASSPTTTAMPAVRRSPPPWRRNWPVSAVAMATSA